MCGLSFIFCVSKIYSSHAVTLHRLVLDSVEKKRIQIHISRKRKRAENCKSTTLNNLLYSRFKTATKIFVTQALEQQITFMSNRLRFCAFISSCFRHMFWAEDGRKTFSCGKHAYGCSLYVHLPC